MHPDKNKDDPNANEKFAEIGNGAQPIFVVCFRPVRPHCNAP